MSDLGVGEEGIKATDVYAKFTASHCHDFFFLLKAVCKIFSYCYM